MNIFNRFWEGLKRFFAASYRYIKRFVNGILNFFKEVVNYLKNLPLIKGRDTPFIVDTNASEFKEMLKRAPVKDCGIFTGTYNEQTDEIENGKMVEADALDERTKQVLDGESLVVLN